MKPTPSARVLARTASFGISLALASLALGQIPFQIVATQGNNAFTVQNGGGLTFIAPVGQMQTVLVKATYTGTGQITIAQQPFIIGSTAFTASFAAATPLNLTPGFSVSVTIQFLPTSAAQSTAQFSLQFMETLPPAMAGGTATTTSNAINLALQGTAPNFVASYVLQTDQNVVSLPPAGTITFPPTVLNTTAQATLSLTNTGSGSGVVTGITLTGSAFRITGRPLFPVTVVAGQSLPVQILYQPTGVSTDTGQIQVTFDSGSPVTINLQGSGSSSSFTYQLLSTTPPTSVPSGGTVSFPDTNIGQSSSVVIRVLNAGNASGTITSITPTGQGYQLINAPALPQTLAPNASLTLTLTFTPTQPGTVKGSLFINSDTLVLSGVGLGSLLSFSYVTGGNTVTLSATNNSVVFSPVTISQSAQVSFDVKNTGTLPATLSNIGIGQNNSPYSVSGLPNLPVTLAPNADFSFTITFTPTALGFSNGTLQLDTTSVALVGSGNQPPPLPSYTIGGPSGTVAPGAQPNVTLTLASSYPVALTGVLTIATSGNLPADPAVQFASGGTTVAFSIPAGSTNALFGTQGTQVGLQTGTVSGAITLTPSFATKAGGVDVTPATPTSLQLAVAPAPPVLIAVEIGSQTTNSFVISVTGLTTTRTLTSSKVQLNTASGFSMPVTSFTIDVSQVSTVYFQSTASRAFGSQFTLSIPFTFQGTVPVGQSLLNSIASVAVTVSNELGASGSVQVNAQ
jgi:hypothetical protein